MATLTHRYEPWGACRELFGTREPQVVLSGPAGTGKSRGCLEYLHWLASNVDGFKALIVRKTQVSLASTALDTYRKFVAYEDLVGGSVTFHGGGPQDPPQYRYASTGAVINIGGMDNATKIMSSEYDVIYVQEATEVSEDDWEMLITRLRNYRLSRQQIIADCNPVQPSHWLKVRCDIGKTLMLHAKHEDNPTLFNVDGTLTDRGDDYINGKLGKLSGVRLQRLRYGRWVAAEGIVYENWDESIHLIDPFDIPDSWERWWSIDFGYVNPFVCQFWATDPDGCLYLYREIYRTRRTVKRHVRTIKEHILDENGEWTEPEPMAVICDHDAEDRATFEEEMEIGTTPAHKSISPGIQALEERLKIRGNGKSRLYVMRGCRVERDPDLSDSKKPTCTAEEFLSYIWDTSGNKAPREKPLDMDNHGMDASRYIVAEHDLGARPRLRVL